MSKFAHLAAHYISPAQVKGAGLQLAFDLESDGLLNTATTIHCVVITDLDTGQVYEYGPAQITDALVHLARADRLVGHNIVTFDLPLLARRCNWAPPASCVIADTLIAGRLILPHVADLDDQAAAMGDPPLGKLRGRYSLEAWGVRLGVSKIGSDITDWSVWTPEMQARCVGDVVITVKLWRFLQADGYGQQAVELEHRVAPICDRITTDGVPFDTAAAEKLHQQWTSRRAELEVPLSQQFPGTNLNSRQQISALLEARGWVPEERTEKTGQPKIDDELLETIHELYPEFAGLAEHYTLGRRLGQLSNGAQAWRKNIGDDGRIHGGLVHIGTPHSRAKHLQPNLAQVPNPTKGKPFAAECRTLFPAPPGWAFVTCDQAGLQDRGYAHYLTEFDGGAYAKAFLAGVDTHWNSAAALDLIPKGTERNKENKVHAAIREHAKTFRYAFLFGCGGKKAGQIIASAARAVHSIDNDNNLLARLFGGSTRPSEAMITRLGKQARDKFIAATPGLAQLRASLEKQVQQRGWLPGLDGRRVPTRAAYSALNFIVTASEAVICKRWLVNVYDELCTRFRYGWDGDVVIVLWVHDEIACCCRPAIADQVGEIMARWAKEAGEYYDFKVPLDAEYKIGRSWAGDPIDDNNKLSSEPAETEDLGILSGSNVELAPIDTDNPPPTRCETAANDPIDERETTPPAPPPPGPPPPPSPGPPPKTDPELGPYIYQDARGGPHAKVVRTPNGRSRFIQQHWDGAAWVTGMAKSKLPYRLPELLAADPDAWVCITEGEKDAVNVARLGLVATTNPNGADGWKSAKLVPYFAPLRRIAILEDKDKAGEARTKRIIDTLHILNPAPDIRVVAFPELPDGGDVSDWLAQDKNRGRAELIARIEATRPVQEVITTEPYRLQNEEDISRWDFLYGRLLLRGEVTGTCAMGGTGKSSSSIVEALAMACRHALLGEHVSGPLRVVLINLEDTRNTMDKRIAAAMRRYGLTQADIDDRLIVKAKGEIKIKVARLAGSGAVERDELIIRALTNLMIEHKADVLSVDSFVRTHKVNENDNSCIEEVVECFEEIATKAQCAVHLWHHTRKQGGEKATIESARGASAFIDAVRSARILETMSVKEHAELIPLQPDMFTHGYYFRGYNGKRNFAPPAEESDWYQIESLELRNGDNVGVVVSWQYPASRAELTAEVVNAVLDELDAGMPNGQRYSSDNAAKGRAAWLVVQKHCPGKTETQCREIIKAWLKKGVIYEAGYEDPVYRRPQKGTHVNGSKRPGCT